MKKFLIGIASATVGLVMFAAPAFADSVSVNFEPTTYSIGNINGQDGWIKTGPYDVAVVANTYGFVNFGGQSLRTSDAVTSGSFGDQTFAKPLFNAVGEADSTNGAFLPGTLQRHFEMQFDIASTLATLQTGMHVSVSPDRGDGSRMSYLRFEDHSDGIQIFFDDVQGTTNPANFVERNIATVSRSPHTIRLTMDTLDGPSNDVVKVYVDGVLKITGTSWENYYRFDHEANAEPTPRIVKTVIFRESGDANIADRGNGFIVDNLFLSSGAIPPTSSNQCKNDGWKNFVDDNGYPFKNQGSCVSYVVKKFGTFIAEDSLYYNCPIVCSNLYATGPVSFTWDKNTGNIIGGYYTENVGGILYYNIITGGSVVGNIVNLTFDRTNPNVNHFTFTGTLVDDVLSGNLDGPYFFTATEN